MERTISDIMDRQEGEVELAYIYRVCKAKGTTPALETWADVGNALNEALGYEYSESYYRKRVQEFDKVFSQLKGEFMNDEYAKMIDKKQDALYKQQVKTRDKMREMRKTLRDEARIEVLRDEVRVAAAKVGPMDLEFYETFRTAEGDNEAILCISDWHTGDKFENFKNAYSLAIEKDRVAVLADDVIRYCAQMGVTKLHVLNLGDMVAGIIHGSIRVESELDIIEQTIQTGEMLAWFLMRLEKNIPELEYHHVLDNHGRVIPKKDEHIEKENFSRLIHWWLIERLQNSGSKVRFFEKELDDNIGTFTLKNGKEVAFVHGHLDRINTVFQNLGGLLRKPLDYIFMGHYHVAKMKEFNGGKVFVNGSLKGVDPYALNNRYMGRASQFLLVLDGENELPFVINVD